MKRFPSSFFLIALTMVINTGVGAAPPMSLHPGSTRDWVRRDRSSPDSILYRLEFLSETSTDTSYSREFFFQLPNETKYVDTTVVVRDSSVDWRVRITRADSPSVADTATLRVLNLDIPLDPRLDGDSVHIRNLAFWTKPSRRFPIDIQANPSSELADFLVLISDQPRNPVEWDILPTGFWEFLVSIDRTKAAVSPSKGRPCYDNVVEGFCGWLPAVTTSPGIGITKWLGQSGFWELVDLDGAPVALSRSEFGHTIRTGENWTYADTVTSFVVAFKETIRRVRFEILEPPTDTAAWTRLVVRETFQPVAGPDSSATLTFHFEPSTHVIRLESDSGSPWNLPKTFEGQWALGLMASLLDPGADTIRSGTDSSWFTGELFRGTDLSSKRGEVISQTMVTAKAVGLVSAQSSQVYDSWGLSSGSYRRMNLRSSKLLAHSLSSTRIGSQAIERHDIDVSWLRGRLAKDPGLALERIGIDGSRRIARGPEAIRLLEERGIAILRSTIDGEVASLRLVRP